MTRTLNESGHVYFSADADIRLRDHFELRMLEENRIPGLLRLSVCDDEGRLRLNYDITGYSPLSERIEENRLTAAEIRQLVLTLKHVISGLAPYLLTAEGIVLTADSVYLDPYGGAPVFLYLPGRNAPFQAALTDFLQTLLAGTDHDDYESVVLAYRLYKESVDHPNALDRLESILISQETADRGGIAEYADAAGLSGHAETPEDIASGVSEEITIEDLADRPLPAPAELRDADSGRAGLFRRLFR